MGVRSMPYMKSSGKPQFAGLGLEVSGGGGGGSYTLPTATASRLGGVKIGSGVNVSSDGTISVSGGGGGSSYNFSTDEVNTGHKWIDGKDIYVRVIENVGKFDTNVVKITKSTYNIDLVIYAYGQLQPSGSTGSIYGSTNFYQDSSVYVRFTEQIGTKVATLVVYYTKS